MRVLAPLPTTATMTNIDDGYQLCARCGMVLVNDEIAVVVPRASFWHIYAHPIGVDCPPKAVKGWKAVRACEAVRNLPNKPDRWIAREAEPFRFLGVALPCVCLLDNKHIAAELRLVDYDASDESPASAGDIRLLLSRLQVRMAGGGKRASAQHPLDRQHASSWHSLARNFVEEVLISSIEAGNLAVSLQILRKELWSYRKSYYSLQTAPVVDSFPHIFVNRLAQREVRVHERIKTRLPKAPGEILTGDVKGRPAEFALYSKRKTLKIGKIRISELEAWAAKPKPTGLSITSTLNPNLYTWHEPPKSKNKPILHWSRSEEQIPFGRVAVLKADVLARLNVKMGFSRRKHMMTRDESIADSRQSTLLTRLR
jgi:hypothetical protein